MKKEEGKLFAVLDPKNGELRIIHATGKELEGMIDETVQWMEIRKCTYKSLRNLTKGVQIILGQM